MLFCPVLFQARPIDALHRTSYDTLLDICTTVQGDEGVAEVITLLRDELKTAMMLTGGYDLLQGC